MNTNIIFLDFDGVIADSMSCYAKEELWAINHTKADALARVSREYQIKWVISSTWRKMFSYTEIRDEEFEGKFNDLLLAENKWCTPITDKGFRGDEINMWIEKHGKPNNYLILDDDRDFHMDQKEKFCLFTDPLNGLSFQDILKIQAHFKTGRM